MQRVRILASVVVGGVFAWQANGVLATNIPITNYDFNTQNLNGNSYAQPASGWDQGPNDGIISNSSYGVTNPPDGDTQGGYFNDYFAQSIGTLDAAATYNVSFYLSANNGATASMDAELVGGNETSGTILASAAFSVTEGATSTYTAESAALVPVGGTGGEPLYLEFVRTGGQNFIDTVTASYSEVPEPSACAAGLILVCGLLGKRYRGQLR